MIRLLFAGSLVLVASRAPAATVLVAAGDVSGLIGAISAANSNADASNIVQLGGGACTLTAADNGTWGPTGLPAITTDLTIEDNGSTLARDAAAPKLRFFAVASGATLTLRNLDLSSGLAQGGAGGSACFGGGGGAHGGAGRTGAGAPESRGAGEPGRRRRWTHGSMM